MTRLPVVQPSIFTPKILGLTDARLAYPLVACRYPRLTLEKWTGFVRRFDEAAAGRLVGLVDSRGRHHAIFAYRVIPAAETPGRLKVTHIVSFQLMGDAINRAVFDTLSALARDNGCSELIVDSQVGLESFGDLAAGAERHGSTTRVLSVVPLDEPARKLN